MLLFFLVKDMKTNIVDLMILTYHLAYAKERAMNMAKKDFYTEIDGSKLMSELKKRDLHATDVSINMGHDKSFISSAVSNGKMHNSDLTLLSYMYNVRKEDIIKVESVKNEPSFEKIPGVDDLVIKGDEFPTGESLTFSGEHKRILRLATDPAFDEEFWSKLEDTMYKAFRRALSE